MKQLSLNPIQQANVDLSMTWKRSCKRLFYSAKTLKEFSDAVRLCGNVAHVSRTIPTKEFAAFAEWLYSHLDEIKNGTFSMTISPFGKYPASWVSKICHIINPHAYPLIWDSHVVAHLKSQNTNWDEAVADAKAKFQDASDEDIYLYDSTLWARE